MDTTLTAYLTYQSPEYRLKLAFSLVPAAKAVGNVVTHPLSSTIELLTPAGRRAQQIERAARSLGNTAASGVRGTGQALDTLGAQTAGSAVAARAPQAKAVLVDAGKATGRQVRALRKTLQSGGRAVRKLENRVNRAVARGARRAGSAVATGARAAGRAATTAGTYAGAGLLGVGALGAGASWLMSDPQDPQNKYARESELALGTRKELAEHGEHFTALARQVAADHLKEDSHYYSKGDKCDCGKCERCQARASCACGSCDTCAAKTAAYAKGNKCDCGKCARCHAKAKGAPFLRDHVMGG